MENPSGSLLDSFYFWRKGIVPYIAKDMKDYVDSRDSVRHKRNGIFVILPRATLTVIPERLDPNDLSLDNPNLKDINPLDFDDIFGYSKGKISDGLSGVVDDAFMTGQFFKNFAEPYMIDTNNPGAESVRTVSDLLVQYRKEADRKLSIIHMAIEFDRDNGVSLKDKLMRYSKEGFLQPQLT